MTTIRVQKHDRNFTIIQNEAIRDTRLSFKARGIHHLLLSYPNDWVVSVKHLASQSGKEGIAAVRAALNELEKYGYLDRGQSRNQGRFGNADYVIYEVSQNPCNQGDSTVVRFDDNGLDVNGESHTTKDLSTKTILTKDKYRTAIPAEVASHGDKSVFSDFDQEQPRDNCTSTQPNDSAGQIPNSENQEPRAGRSKKPNKPKTEKRKKFDGTFGLSCDRSGWIKLPETRDIAGPLRTQGSLAKTQTMLWMKEHLATNYHEELEIYSQYDDFMDAWYASGKDFDDVPWDDFISADGPMPVRLMRDVLASRIGGFQEVFNEQMNDYFWQAWHKFSKQSA